MRLADHGLGAFGEQRDVDRGLGHQVGDELGAVGRIEFVGFGEGHAEEASGEPVPEGRMAGFVHHSAKLGQHPVAEARPVLLDEQIAAAREQRAPAPGADRRMEEQPADLG